MLPWHLKNLEVLLMRIQRGKVLLSAFIMLSMILSMVLFAPFAKTVNAGIVASGSCGDNVTYTLDDAGKLTISGTGPMYDYKSNGSNLSPFADDDDIKSVVINSGVTSIGVYAFHGCKNLTSVTIPSSVIVIGGFAFYDNSSLQSVTIPNGVKAIESYAFYGCDDLTSVTIPNSVTSIDYVAFGCTGLTSVTIPSSVTSLDPQAFSGGLVSINVNSNNPNYCSENGIVFNKDKTEIITFPKGKTDASYTIPSSVTSIGESAFNGCYNLTSVTIPDGVTTIGTYAFGYCNNLKKVVIPESVNEIGYHAFNNCPVTIYCAAGSYAQTYAETNGLSYKCWVSVKYETNGGTAFAPEQLWVGEYATTPPDPTKTGYTFGGWYTDSACTSTYDFNTQVTGNITLYAKWTVAPTTAPTVKPTVVPTATPASKPTAMPTATTTPTKMPTTAPSRPTTAPAAVNLTLDKTTVQIKCGGSDTLKATLSGSSDKISWKSSDAKVAKVDANGKVTTKQAGTVTITASAADKSATCVVTVLYKDVTNTKDFWYAPTNYLTAANVVKGYDKQTKFKPANDCTRAQMVTFLWRLAGEPAPKSTTTKFKDIKSKDYFYKPVLWAVEKGITTGVSKTKFNPKGVCTRAQTVTFLWRMANKPAPKTTKNKFSDVKSKDYFYKAVLWASEQKIVAGYNDGTFKPQGKCLRRQMVTFLYKYDKFVNGKG